MKILPLNFIFVFQRLPYFTLENAIKTLNINLLHINEDKTQVTGGHTIKTTLIDAIFYMYIHMTSRDIWGDTIFTSEVIKRSLEVNILKIRSHSGYNVWFLYIFWSLYPVYILVYAGNGLIWDLSSCVICIILAVYIIE